MKKSIWLKAKVIKGKQIGRTLGLPTINLDNPSLLSGQNEGVYACLVKIDNNIHQGLLYYGPRLILNEKENILEIYLFDFDKDIYGQEVLFLVKDYIREVQNFPDFDAFKKQLASDGRKAKQILLQ